MDKQVESVVIDTKFKRTMLWLKFAIVIFPLALLGQIWILYQEHSFTNLIFVLITAFALYSTIASYKKFKAYEAAAKNQQ
jgi:hypothetical protein